MAQLDGEVTDVLGQTINAGDQIAGAFRIGNVAVLRVGTVLGFAERGNKLTVRVQWHHGSNQYGGSGAQEVDIVGAIEAKLTRFVKLNRPVNKYNFDTPGSESVMDANAGQEAVAEVPVVNP